MRRIPTKPDHREGAILQKFVFFVLGAIVCGRYSFFAGKEGRKVKRIVYTYLLGDFLNRQICEFEQFLGEIEFLSQ